MKKLLLIPALLFAVLGAAQTLPPNTEQQLENLAEESPEDDALLQTLAFFRKHPLNLNTATADDLQGLRLLSDLQIAALLQHRRLFGHLVHLLELQAISYFDLETIQKLRPYVYVGSSVLAKDELRQRLRNGDREGLIRMGRTLQRSRGYDTSRASHYLGTPYRLQVRYRYQHKTNLYYGLVADKDAGEQFLRGAQKSGFDFYSFHFFVRNLGRLKALALGDYAVNLGQGLVQWQALAFGKSADVLGIKRQSPVLLPYRSAGEFLFNRGAAATWVFRRWEVTGFVSAKKITGNLAVDSIRHFTSFGTTGLHRTANEAADRRQINHLSAGGNLAYNNNNLQLAINAVWHRFSLPLYRPDEPYHHFSFRGQQAFNSSISHAYTHRNLHWFGEVAVDGGGHPAIVQGLLASLHRQVDLSVLYRHLPARYQSLFGNAFSESTLPQNETGLYTGLVLRPSALWHLSAYADVFRFPFLRYRVSAPAGGADYLTQLTYTPDKTTEVYLRYRAERKPENEAVPGRAINWPTPWLRKNLRLHFAKAVHPQVLLKGRAELLWFAQGALQQQGFLVFAEGGTEPLKGWRTTVRLQYFETAGFDSRIYAYETDVLYSFSIPAFSGQGARAYLLINGALSKRWAVWVRLAHTAFMDRQTVGSGLDEIDGRRRTDLTMQARYSF